MQKGSEYESFSSYVIDDEDDEEEEIINNPITKYVIYVWLFILILVLLSITIYELTKHS